jgi:hypothetical protein
MHPPKYSCGQLAELIRGLSESEKQDLGTLLFSPLSTASVGRFRRTETGKELHSIVRRDLAPSTTGKTLGPVALVRAAYHFSENPLTETATVRYRLPGLGRQVEAAAKMASLMARPEFVPANTVIASMAPLVSSGSSLVSQLDTAAPIVRLLVVRSMAGYFIHVARGKGDWADYLLVFNTVVVILGVIGWVATHTH